MLQTCITAEQLRKALVELEAAEKNGFHHCLAVFDVRASGSLLSNCRATYSDLWERAHPTNGNMDWGRFQGVSKSHRFAEGILTGAP